MGTQSVIEYKYWPEHRHCSHGNDIFQTLNSNGIMEKHDGAVQYSFFSRLVKIEKKSKFKQNENKVKK